MQQRNPFWKRVRLAATLGLPMLLLPAGAAGQQQSPPAQFPPKPADTNPFPEDTNSVPVLPTARPAAELPPTEAAPLAAHVEASDSDPVRSPDEPVGEPASGSDRDFSSSSAGLERVGPPAEPDTPAGRHGKKQKTDQPEHVETAQEHENVGAYYLSIKNWRAALSRFQSALVLDPENPNVYWGLAEAQRHLGDLPHARENYGKVMEYDPDSKHAKESKKLLAGPEMAHAGTPPASH